MSNNQNPNPQSGQNIRKAGTRASTKSTLPKIAWARLLSFLVLWLVSTGCGKPVFGVYVYQRDYTVYGVAFTKTSTFDLRSDGTFRFEFDPGKPANNIIPGNREVVEGKWKGSGGRITCYNGDGSEFSHLKQEGGDFINDQGMRYRRD